MRNKRGSDNWRVKGAEKIFGFLPNLLLDIVKSPAAAETYLHGTSTLKTVGSLNCAELPVVYLAISAWKPLDTNGKPTDTEIKEIEDYWRNSNIYLRHYRYSGNEGLNDVDQSSWHS